MLGSSFARSRLRNAWTTYSASLSKEGYAAMDHWVPPDEAHKWDLERLLDYLESTLDDEITPQVHVYELEDVKKRSDESVDELIDRICQFACHVQIGNGSNAAIEFEVQGRLIQAILDADIELQKELIKVTHDKKVSHLLEISCMYYAIESGVAGMCASKAIHDLCQGQQPQKNKLQNVSHNAPIAPINTPLAVTTALHRMPSAEAVLRKVTGMPSATALVLWANSLPSLMQLRRAPIIDAVERGKIANIAQVSTGERPPYNELFVNAVYCGTIGDTHPEEIVVDDVHAHMVQWGIYNGTTACKHQQ